MTTESTDMDLVATIETWFDPSITDDEIPNFHKLSEKTENMMHMDAWWQSTAVIIEKV